jgi:two-component system, NarL family, sensor histidine kinase DesK
MKWPELPTGENKPPWGALFGAASMAYLFVAAYRADAAPAEWLWTGLVFACFLVLYAIGVVFWSQRRIVLRVCIGLALLGAAFTAYRPSGIIFFVYIAALGPFAAGGRIGGSAAIVLLAALALLAQWHLFWPPAPFPYVFATVSIVLGAALTVVARQRAALARFHKTAERERIARDLHDILGHTLSVVILKSDLAVRLVEQDAQRARKEIEEVERISRQALAEVREAIAGYRSGDLRAEFERAGVTLATAGIAVDGDCEPSNMPAAHERALALVLREAVTNVIRHARASRCHMNFSFADGGYRLEVGDDGRGGALQEGMGMQGIRERVRALGGTATWRAASPRGTTLVVTVPAAGAST